MMWFVVINPYSIVKHTRIRAPPVMPRSARAAYTLLINHLVANDLGDDEL